MKILNAKICSNGQIFDGEVTVDGERIASVTPKETSSSSDETIIDAKGMYVIPGLLDVHFHGCVGYDTCDASKEAFDKIAEYEGSEGVLAICPATMTYQRISFLRLWTLQQIMKVLWAQILLVFI